MWTYPGGDALPAHDYPPVVGVHSFYIIASTPRSGSTLLARTLGETGVAGRPAEYLNGELAAQLGARTGATNLVELLQAVMRLRTSPNGVFGLKLHWIQLEGVLLAAGLDPARALRPSPRWIWMRRRDTLRQAISMVRARQTGAWHSTVPATAEPAYRGAAIARALTSLVAKDAAWQAYFEERGVEPCVVWYRDLVADRGAALRRVLDTLGIQADVPLPPPGLQRQADDLTEEWVARYRKEARARGESLPSTYGAGP